MAARTVKASIQVTKVDAELGIIWGWVSVADLLDLQGDIIPQDEVVKMMYQFMEDYYDGSAYIKDNHGEQAPTVLVESTLEFRATHVCWWVGVKLRSDELREAARNGEISGFSIGGTADGEAD